MGLHRYSNKHKSSKMKQILFLLLVLAFSLPLQAQKKSELLYEIQLLKKEIRSWQDSVAQVKKAKAASDGRVQAVEFELEQIRETNANLLENLNKFTTQSVQRTENIGKSLEDLREKEQKLQALRDRIGANDSLTLKLLTELRGFVDETKQLKVEKGAITFVYPSTAFYPADSLNANGLVKKLEKVMTDNPEAQLILRGEISSYQSPDYERAKTLYGTPPLLKKLSEYLQREGSPLKGRIQTLHDKSTRSDIYFQVVPDYALFYLQTRETLK